jgi:hypothetical protein
MALKNKVITMNNHKVILKNGSEVTWEEFSSWSEHKQSANLVPISIESQQARHEKVTSRNSARNCEVSISKANSTFRAVKTPKGRCKSVAEAGLLNGVCANTIINWIKRGKKGFSYVAPPLLRKTPINLKKSVRRESIKAVLTPDGRFPNARAVANFYGIHINGVYMRIKKDTYPEFRYDSSIKITTRSVITPKGSYASAGEAAKVYKMSAQAMRQRLNSSSWVDFCYEDL